MNSKFIVIEGLEGAGKTCAIIQVIDTLKKNGIYNVISTREPGGTPLAETLRKLIKNKDSGEQINHYTELMMFYAARIQLVENVIKPALANGSWVVSDRHDLSSKAYQGGGHGVNAKLLQTIRDLTLGDFYPDLTLYLDISPVLSLARTRTRGVTDRIEMESLEFFERTRTRYQELAATDNHIITIDASQPYATVNNNIYNQITQWLTQQVF